MASRRLVCFGEQSLGPDSNHWSCSSQSSQEQLGSPNGGPKYFENFKGVVKRRVREAEGWAGVKP